MSLYAVGFIGRTLVELNLDGSEVTDVPIDDVGVGGNNHDQNACVGPDGTVYFFPTVQMDVSPFSLWQTIVGNLAGGWAAGPPVDDGAALAALEGAGLNGRATTGVVTADGALNVVFTSTTSGGDAFMLRFPDPAAGVFELVARWPGAVATDLGEVGASAVGTDVYVYRIAGTVVRKVTQAGVVSVVMDTSGTAYIPAAPAVAVSGRVYALGFDGSAYAVLTCLPAAPTAIDVLTTWVHAGNPLLPNGTDGTGVLLDGYYYVSSGRGYAAIGRYSLLDRVMVPWAAIGSKSTLAALPGVVTGLPPLRQFPRDDTTGGSPRQDKSSTSLQSSARQGWTSTYR